jgi:hypothetical protein
MDLAPTSGYWIYLAQARNAPRSNTETRIAFVSQQLGLSDADLEPFFYVRRKGSKKRYFDQEAFAKNYGISVRWLWDGSLREYPRHLNSPDRRNNSGARKQRRSKNGTPQERAAKLAQAKTRPAAADTLPCSDADRAYLDRHFANLDNPSVADPPFVEFLRQLGGYIVQQFARGKDIDQIFDELIADALQKGRRT